MGTDIKLKIQVKNGNKWIFVDDRVDSELLERDYDSFALLADVRNGRGFADCVTGEGFNPICKRKGLPAEIDDEEQFGYYGYSYLTLEEIEEYNWSQETTKCCVLTRDEYIETIKTNEEPKMSYGAGVMGKNTCVISQEQFNKGAIFPKNIEVYVEYSWQLKYTDTRVYSVFIPILQQLAEKHNVGNEGIRIVFGFWD